MATTHYQVRTILDTIGDRARGMLGTAPGSANWKRAVNGLTQALQQAQALIQQGRGQVPWNLWRRFINAVANAGVLLTNEKRKAASGASWNTAGRQKSRLIRDLGMNGLGDDEDEEMTFTIEQAESMQAAKSPQVQAAERAESRAYVQEFVKGERDAIARGELQASTALETSDSIADFWAMLNPPDTPIYTRPIFLFAAAGATVAVYVYGSRYTEQQEQAAPMLPERRLA